MEWVNQQRATTQVARADDQAVLAGLREQLEATCVEAFTATCQQILANNRAALAEAARDRVKAEATQQARIEWDLRHQLAHTQKVVVDLQHEVHFMNNQLHPILDEEEEDPKMFIEDDGWEEEEVVPMDEGEALSDLDSDHVDV